MQQEQIERITEAYLDNYRNVNVALESIEHIRNHLQILQIKSKENLITPGMVCKDVYFVVKGGFVCRYIDQKTEQEKTIMFYLKDLHPLMTCLDSYFDQVPTHCELKAIADSIVVALPKTEVDVLNTKDQQFYQAYMGVITTAMVGENEIKAKLISYTAKEKYTYVLEQMPSVIQTVPSKYIAEFCGVTPEWLSKLKRQS